MLGIVYAVGDAAKTCCDAARAGLDGLVLEGDSRRNFLPLAQSRRLHAADRDREGGGASRWNAAPIFAVEGVAPSAHNLSEMGIRGAPSSEPWIESNIWLVHSLTVTAPPRPLWISSQLEHASAVDYARAVADAAVAGGRWIVWLDDPLRAKAACWGPLGARELAPPLQLFEIRGEPLAGACSLPHMEMLELCSIRPREPGCRRRVPEARGAPSSALPTDSAF